MKIYRVIVQSKEEPDKNCLWLKDGKLYMFGSNGWELVNGAIITEALDRIKDLERRVSALENTKSTKEKK